MKLFIPILLLMVIAVTACKKDNSFCGYKDPINEIAWLKDFANSEYILGCDIYKAVYKDTSGFYIVIYRDSARTNTATSFTNCDGHGICSTGGITPPNCPDYKQHESYRELIYSR